MNNIPRPEHPRPDMMRKDWINLNGEWEFEIDNEMCGEAKKFFINKSFSKKIIVPFCPESKLSGIGNADFLNCVWYKKSIALPQNFSEKNILLHFGAVDYHSVLYVNGEKVGEHFGGYTSFSFDITKYLSKGENSIVLCAYDDIRSENQPCGKQSQQLESYGCFYTRTTGIWQTVWLEAVSKSYITSYRATSDITNSSCEFSLQTTPCSLGSTLEAIVTFSGKEVGRAKTVITGMSQNLSVALSQLHLWAPGEGNLYDVTFIMSDSDKITDELIGYFGMRSVALTENAMAVNGKKVFGRWVLDQGFYPDGIYTAPTDDALRADVENSMKLGFNGARLHEKVFEPRFLHWADKLGYMVWGEHANWGLDITSAGQIQHFLPEWIESVERDYSHPSIVGWCPFNETWDLRGKCQDNSVLRMVYLATKAIDKTRPVIDTSGNYHVVTDIFDIHNYTQSPEEFYQQFQEEKLFNQFPDRQQRNGEPYFVSEYGGIQWDTKKALEKSWGYGSAPKTEEEFIERYRGLTDVLLNHKDVFAFCYTQLYDVEQETNGLMTYDRQFKFDPEIFYKINTKKAKIEE